MRDIYDTTDPRNVIYQHKPTLYRHLIIPIWFVFSAVLTYFMIMKGTIPTWNNGHFILAGLTIFVLLLDYIYFFIAMQSICYVIAYETQKKYQVATEKHLLNLPQPTPTQWGKVLPTHHQYPRVALIYCTYNDFLPDCLYQSFTLQHYPWLNVKILDDSTKPKYKHEVDKFAKLNPDVQVIRRKKHSWNKNKAGNLNHGLKVIKNQHYDFFVFLDSDELLEPDFVHKMLKEFYYGDKFGYHIGLIQATHHSGRNVNLFMKVGALSAKYFWNVQNTVRSDEAGIRNIHNHHVIARGDTVMSNLGHGCMADANAIYQSGLFPNLVSEDVANTMSMIHHGWNVYFSTQIHGNEETIISMNAMRTRSSKFAAGNLQWIHYYWNIILHSYFSTQIHGNEETIISMNAMRTRSSKFAAGNLQWIHYYWNIILHSFMLSRMQKVDAYMLMCTADIGSFLYITVPICSVVFPLDHGIIGTSAIFLIPCILIMYSASIIDTCFSFANGMNLWEIIKREILVMAMYSSTYYLGVKVVFEALFLHRKAKFNVTPKSLNRVTVRQAINNNLPEMLFSLITIAYVFYFSGLAGWMVLLAYVPPLLAPLTELSENKQTPKEKHYAKMFDTHRKQSLKYDIIPHDVSWDNWKV